MTPARVTVTPAASAPTNVAAGTVGTGRAIGGGMFTMQTRSAYRISIHSTLELAISAGRTLGVPFDVSAPSGAIVWAWDA